jgi:hypothetical protein
MRRRNGAVVEKSNALRMRILVLVASLCCGLAAYVLVWQPVWLIHWRDFRKAEDVISRVEAFRHSHGYPPETLDAVGLADPYFNVFYQRNGDKEYYVWFGITVGESETYDSQTQLWD